MHTTIVKFCLLYTSTLIDNSAMINWCIKYPTRGCYITYEFAEDIERKINWFQAVCSIIKRTLGRKQGRKLKWSSKRLWQSPIFYLVPKRGYYLKQIQALLQAADMNFLRYVKGCTRNCRVRKDVIRHGLGIFSDVYKRQF